MGQGALTTAPDAASGTRIWREPSPESDAAMKRYGARLLDILELPLPLEVGTNTLAPRALPLSCAARRLWIAFYNHVEERVAYGGEIEPVRGHAKKPFDENLMISPEDPYLEAYAKAGADGLTVHPESGPHVHRTLQQASV